ncbi:hypothetical protein [Streptomyces sp. SID12501]|uniref:Lipoprotein n=1 Tax=Streptomyces sp. SID12501 TaxID=2706042 RepID=A0A6B3BUI2_9ACTN|nr:hypothetical protein [Streptomyces sp. SID12501]NEC87916.1 hypothetical protein [Streptomyces sp. SID12501]
MAGERTTSRLRPRHRTVRAVVLLTALGTATLTGCGGSGENTAAQDKPAAAAGTPSADHSAATTAPPSTPPPTAKGAATKPAAPAPVSAPAPAPEPASVPTPAADSGPTPGCDHKMPISPDEVAVYGYTPEGGSLSLIVKAGAWGCPDPDTDGPPFVTTGKEYALPLDQAAYVTATNPITESSENQHIGVQELLDWLDAHPDSGLVFKYHAGADGTVDDLQQEFTP